jgi:MSHA biogenesis protein MshI
VGALRHGAGRRASRAGDPGVIQQVNLYRDDVVLRAPKLDARALLQLLAALACALLAVSVGLVTWGWLQGRALADLRESNAAGQRDLAALEARYASHADSAALDAEIARLDSELRARQHLIELIRTSSVNRSGFSAQLEGLALGRIPGMWLESFALSQGGRGLELAGRALRPDRVPGFVLELGQQAPFAGTEFEALLLERPAGSGALRFEIRTAVPEATAAAGGAG